MKESAKVLGIAKWKGERCMGNFVMGYTNILMEMGKINLKDREEESGKGRGNLSEGKGKRRKELES